MEILLYPEILIGVRWTFVDATTLLDYYGNPIFFHNNFFYPSFFNFFFEQGFNLYDRRFFRTGHFVLKNDYIYDNTGFLRNIQQFRANL
jgi:hypothetical protein